AAVYCGHDLIIDGHHLAPLARSKDVVECRRDIEAFQMPGHDPTGMYRWSMVKEFRYDPNLPIAEGFDYILRIGEQLPMLVAGECLYGYRIHSGSVTKRDPEYRDRLVREVLRRACQRRGLNFDERFPTPDAPAKRSNRDIDNNIAAHFMESACAL